VELGRREVDEPMALWVETVLRSAVNQAKGVKLEASGSAKVRLNLSWEALESGFNLEHLGGLIITGLRNEFPAIGPVRVTLTLDEEAERLYSEAQAYARARALKVREATDESEPFFYGCTRCRSFSLAHACTSTPDRPPQCGSRPWYRVKAQAILAPDSIYNPSQVIGKGRCLDEVRGEYVGVNKSTAERTGGRVARVYLHTIFDFPHTACSCLQNIAFYIAEVDGIGLIHRGYPGVTPNGLTWTKLANLIAGRQYGGGAASFSVDYMKSRKFLQGDGGWNRIVWLTETLKKAAGEAIPTRLRESIATESDVTTMEELKNYLKEKDRLKEG
jgi:acetyl-CoA decarbonylase/synthase complex subunit beta